MCVSRRDYCLICSVAITLGWIPVYSIKSSQAQQVAELSTVSRSQNKQDPYMFSFRKNATSIYLYEDLKMHHHQVQCLGRHDHHKTTGKDLTTYNSCFKIKLHINNVANQLILFVLQNIRTHGIIYHIWSIRTR